MVILRYPGNPNQLSVCYWPHQVTSKSTFGLYSFNSASLVTLAQGSAFLTDQPSSTTCSYEKLICEPTYFSWLSGSGALNQSLSQPLLLIPSCQLDLTDARASVPKSVRNFSLSNEITYEKKQPHAFPPWSRPLLIILGVPKSLPSPLAVHLSKWHVLSCIGNFSFSWSWVCPSANRSSLTSEFIRLYNFQEWAVLSYKQAGKGHIQTYDTHTKTALMVSEILVKERYIDIRNKH